MQNKPKSILITGASSGIGAALSRHYAEAGTTLHLSGRDEDRLTEVANDCAAQGAAVHPFRVDVTDASAMSAWIAEADQMRPLDLVVANAGMSGGTSGGLEPSGQVRRILEVNVTGVMNTALPALDHMSARNRGQIAIVSSLAGFQPLASAPAYSTSKAAVRHYGESLRIPAARAGVGVSVICPGYVHSRMTAANPFPMPFIMPAEKAARIIADGLSRNRARIAFPIPMYAVAWCRGTLCPTPLRNLILGRLPEKPATPADGA